MRTTQQERESWLSPRSRFSPSEPEPGKAKSKPLTKNQRKADTNTRALATAVQARGITNGAYDNNIAGYAKDFGGSLPVNPCTGTRSGYGVTIKGKTAKVFAIKGKLCGEWTPMVYSISL